jgi:hypothetical protein
MVSSAKEEAARLFAYYGLGESTRGSQVLAQATGRYFTQASQHPAITLPDQMIAMFQMAASLLRQVASDEAIAVELGKLLLKSSSGKIEECSCPECTKRRNALNVRDNNYTASALGGLARVVKEFRDAKRK